MTETATMTAPVMRSPLELKSSRAAPEVISCCSIGERMMLANMPMTMIAPTTATMRLRTCRGISVSRPPTTPTDMATTAGNQNVVGKASPLHISRVFSRPKNSAPEMRL